MTPKSPNSSTARIMSLDVVRGIAIMGILLVNGPTLNGPAIKDGFSFAFQNTIADIWYIKIISSFAVANFYPIFACLFGLSGAIFMASKPMDLAQKLLIKRMSVLLIFGFLHATLIWSGDILVVYALLGMSLTYFYRKEPDDLWYYLKIIVMVALILSVSFFYYLPNRQPALGTLKALLIYSQGDFWAVTQQRFMDFLGAYLPGYFYDLDLFQIIDYLMFYVQLYMCLLFGYWVFVSGWLYRITKDYLIAKRTALITFTITFVISIIAESFPLLGEALFVVKGFSRGVFYASTIMFLCHNAVWLKIFYPFSLVGKMSLSNYILHNLLLSLIFYGYGLGLFGQIGPFAQAPILLGLMVFSVLFSSLWLKYFNWGPLEWLWRAATQGEFSVLRKSREVRLIPIR